MDNSAKNVLSIVGINVEDMEEKTIMREVFLCPTRYNEVKKYIEELRNSYSSSSMTSLQDGAEKNQRWPLLNIVRQILNVYNYKMVPIRESDGYSEDGKKRYRRKFRIEIKN